MQTYALLGNPITWFPLALRLLLHDSGSTRSGIRSATTRVFRNWLRKRNR